MAIQLYPQSSYNAFHGVGISYPPDVDQAVQQIYGACKGFGTDEQTLISVLGSKSPETRTLIALRYEELYKKPLRDLVKSETSGDFGRLLRMISTPLHETEAQLLRDATKGVGTTESLIVQILSGRTNVEMDILKRSFFKLFNKDLAVTISSELSGDLKKVMMAVLQSQQLDFNPAYHTTAKAEEEATKLYKAGQGRLGTNEEVFIGILVACPPEFLVMVDAAYVRKHNNNIAKAIDKEFSGDAKKSLTYLVKSVMDPFPTIAEVFEKTMKGFGTNETGLSTALVRYHGVLPQVKSAYKKMYGKELRDRIYGETSGDYRKLLLEIYDAPQDPPVTKNKPSAPAASGAVAQAPVPGAYPTTAPGGYPAPQGYPASASAYPGVPTPGYAPQGYTNPPQGQHPGYPQGYPPPGSTGYPAQAAPSYPPQAPPGCPPQQYPPQQYPPQQYPPQQYPPQQYPPQQYPPQQYPPQQYPPQQYPPPQGQYPPTGQFPAYPHQGYPPQGTPPQGYPSQVSYPSHPPQGQYPPPGQYPPRGY